MGQIRSPARKSGFNVLLRIQVQRSLPRRHSLPFGKPRLNSLVYADVKVVNVNMNNIAIDGDVHRSNFYPTARQDLLQALSELENHLITVLNTRLNQQNGIKWWIAAFITFTRVTAEGEVEQINAVFVSSTRALFIGDNFERDIASAFNEIYNKQEEFIELGSSWTLKSIDRFSVNTIRFEPLQAGTYV